MLNKEFSWNIRLHQLKATRKFLSTRNSVIVSIATTDHNISGVTQVCIFHFSLINKKWWHNDKPKGKKGATLSNCIIVHLKNYKFHVWVIFWMCPFCSQWMTHWLIGFPSFITMYISQRESFSISLLLSDQKGYHSSSCCLKSVGTIKSTGPLSMVWPWSKTTYIITANISYRPIRFQLKKQNTEKFKTMLIVYQQKSNLHVGLHVMCVHDAPLFFSNTYIFHNWIVDFWSVIEVIR